MEGEAPGGVFEEPEGAAAGVVLAAVGPPVGAGEGVGGQGDGVGDGAGVEVGDLAWGEGLGGEEDGEDGVAGVEAAGGADLGEGLVEEGFEGGAGWVRAGGEVGVFEGEELGGKRAHRQTRDPSISSQLSTPTATHPSNHKLELPCRAGVA